MGTDNMKRWVDFGGGVGKYCRGCTEREPGCHDTCEKYLKAKEEREVQKQMIEESAKNDKQYSYYKYYKIVKERKR